MFIRLIPAPPNVVADRISLLHRLFTDTKRRMVFLMHALQAPHAGAFRQPDDLCRHLFAFMLF